MCGRDGIARRCVRVRAALCGIAWVCAVMSPGAAAPGSVGPSGPVPGLGVSQGSGTIVHSRIGTPIGGSARFLDVQVLGGSAAALAATARVRVASAPATLALGAGAALSVQVAVPGFAGVPPAVLNYRQGGARGEIRVPPEAIVGGTDQEFTIPPGFADDRGIEYYATVRIGALRLSDPPVDPFDHSYRIRTQLSDYAAGGALATGHQVYRMVSFPLALASRSVADVLGDDLGPWDDTQWRFGRYDPARSGAETPYREYQGSDAQTDPLDPGNAFWLITAQAKTVDVTGKSQIPAAATAAGVRGYDVPLEPGWNQIGNPFAFPVDVTKAWVSVGGNTMSFSEAVSAGLLEANPLREFVAVSSTYTSTQTFEPWKGYFIANNDAASRRITLTVPYESASGTLRGGEPAGGPAGAEPVWDLAVAISPPEGGEGRPVLLGLLEGAREGLDGADALAAPMPPGAWTELHSENEALPEPTRRMERDYRPFAAGRPIQERWELVLRSPEGGVARLELRTGRDELPAGVVARLVDLESRRTVDLRSAPGSYEFVLAPEREGRRFLVLVGSEEFVESQTASELGEGLSFALSRIAPNPASSRTFLQFSLPREERAQVRIFDVTGRLVRTLADGPFPAGRHTLMWDGRADSGERAASGVYYVQLRAGEGARTRKVVLLR